MPIGPRIRQGWKNPEKNVAKWRNQLHNYAGALGDKPVDEITTADVTAVDIAILSALDLGGAGWGSHKITHHRNGNGAAIKARLESGERRFDRMERQLDTIENELRQVSADTAYLRGRADAD